MAIEQQAEERHVLHAVEVTVATVAIAAMTTTHTRPGRTPRREVEVVEAVEVVEVKSHAGLEQVLLSFIHPQRCRRSHQSAKHLRIEQLCLTLGIFFFAMLGTIAKGQL